jgi:hypothetical protein
MMVMRSALALWLMLNIVATSAKNQQHMLKMRDGVELLTEVDFPSGFDPETDKSAAVFVRSP